MSGNPATLQGESPVLLRRDGGIAHIRFNRPGAFNAVNLALAQAFHAACREVAADPRVRVLLLSGEGRAFMTGGDLAAMQSGPAQATATIVAEMHAAIELLDRLEVPVIAAVQGLAAGGGLGVALSADLVIAADNARFHLANPLIGASPDCGTTWGLPRWVGLRRALELALLAEPVGATQALEWGLINRVVAVDRLMPEAEAMALRLESGAPLALARTKRLLREAGTRGLSAQLQAEADSFAACAASTDFAEGVAAVLGKRTARFNGS